MQENGEAWHERNYLGQGLTWGPWWSPMSNEGKNLEEEVLITDFFHDSLHIKNVSLPWLVRTGSVGWVAWVASQWLRSISISRDFMVVRPGHSMNIPLPQSGTCSVFLAPLDGGTQNLRPFDPSSPHDSRDLFLAHFYYYYGLKLKLLLKLVSYEWKYVLNGIKSTNNKRKLYNLW